MRPLPYRNDVASNFWWRHALGPLLIGSVIGLFVLFRCSGLHFPFWNAPNHLAGRLSGDLTLTLPPSARVTHSAWEAYSDPSEFYVIEMSVADAAAFVSSLRSVASLPFNSDPKSATIRIPTWWMPQTLPGLQALEARRGQGVYRFFFADTVGTVYLVWQDT